MMLTRWHLISMALLAASTFIAASPAPADDDPFAWLEEVEGAKALAWVKEQNAKSTALLEKQGEELADIVTTALTASTRVDTSLAGLLPDR